MSKQKPLNLTHVGLITAVALLLGVAWGYRLTFPAPSALSRVLTSRHIEESIQTTTRRNRYRRFFDGFCCGHFVLLDSFWILFDFECAGSSQ